MKLVKKFAVAVLFVSVLGVPTFAGDMQTPGKTDPPPPPPSGCIATTTDETTDTSTTVVAQPSDATSGVSNDLLYDAFVAMLGLY